METMNQVQWIQIREAESIELMRCDSILSAEASAPPAGRRGVERNTTSIQILFLPIHMLLCISNALLRIRDTSKNSSWKIFFLSEVLDRIVSFFFSLTTPACAVMGRCHEVILRVSNKKEDQEDLRTYLISVLLVKPYPFTASLATILAQNLKTITR